MPLNFIKKGENHKMDEEYTSLLIKLNNKIALEAQFVAGLFSFCEHEYFHYDKPSIESRIKALRFIADILEINFHKTQTNQ